MVKCVTFLSFKGVIAQIAPPPVSAPAAHYAFPEGIFVEAGRRLLLS